VNKVNDDFAEFSTPEQASETIKDSATVNCACDPHEKDVLPPGYTLVSILCEAAGSTVYKAIAASGAFVAIKKSRTHSTNDIQNECRLMIQASGTNVVGVQEHGVHRDCYYIAMDFIDGECLKHLAHNSHLSCREVFAVGLALLAALDDIHSKGVLHGDVNMANVFIRSADRNICFIDFGGGGGQWLTRMIPSHHY
jgi:serine/threonine protein kinase